MYPNRTLYPKLKNKDNGKKGISTGLYDPFAMWQHSVIQSQCHKGNKVVTTKASVSQLFFKSRTF